MKTLENLLRHSLGSCDYVLNSKLNGGNQHKTLNVYPHVLSAINAVNQVCTERTPSFRQDKSHLPFKQRMLRFTQDIHQTYDWSDFFSLI